MPNFKIVLIGGSAGSFSMITNIVNSLPANYKHTIVLCLHRLKHIRHGFVEALNIKSKLQVIEPNDKQEIESGKIYLAPANYHLLADDEFRFSLSIDEPVKFSRPSIDLSFDTFSYIYKERMIGILLSGANTDGADGLHNAHKRRSFTIIQNLEEAPMKTMPKGALDLFKPDKILKEKQIIDFITNID